MRNMLNSKKFFAFALIALPTLCGAQLRSALGPVETVTLGQQVNLTVLGQTFALNDATQIAASGKRYSSRSVDLLTQGQIVYVEGVDSGNRSIATAIVVTDTGNVPGATEVHVLGPVSQISFDGGSFLVGALRIDATTVDFNIVSRLRVGTVVMVSGVQPLPGGDLIRPTELTVSGFRTLSVGGSGVLSKQSVGGSGVLSKFSVGGSGVLSKQSVGGSGVLSKFSVGGSGVLSKQSVGGSGVVSKQSVGGSGVLSKFSVGGSGVVSKQSVGGSGVLSKFSVGGSGVLSKFSVGGSGVLSKQSVGGSGVLSKFSVGGSGVLSKQSVGGSGVLSKDSVGGSGVSTLSSRRWSSETPRIL